MHFLPNAFLLLMILSLPQLVRADDPILTYYIFENHGRTRNGKMILENKDNFVTNLNVMWFDWSCNAQKQRDGVLMDCKRGNEFVETKVYCNIQQGKFGRLVRLGKGENFITFEAKCSANQGKETTLVIKNNGSKKNKSAPKDDFDPDASMDKSKEAPEETILEN